MDRVNDFAFKIATANGTGSASANRTMSGYDTQYGAGMITSSPGSSVATSAL